jgi:hypothetical protein
VIPGLEQAGAAPEDQNVGPRMGWCEGLETAGSRFGEFLAYLTTFGAALGMPPCCGGRQRTGVIGMVAQPHRSPQAANLGDLHTTLAACVGIHHP